MLLVWNWACNQRVNSKMFCKVTVVSKCFVFFHTSFTGNAVKDNAQCINRATGICRKIDSETLLPQLGEKSGLVGSTKRAQPPRACHGDRPLNTMGFHSENDSKSP